eukprot:1533432-Rhodomonas_salina.1
MSAFHVPGYFLLIPGYPGTRVPEYAVCKGHYPEYPGRVGIPTGTPAVLLHRSTRNSDFRTSW